MILPVGLFFALLLRFSYDFLFIADLPADGARAVGTLGLVALSYVVFFELFSLLRLLVLGKGRESFSRSMAFERLWLRFEGVLPVLCYGVLLFFGKWPAFVRFSIEPGLLSLHELLVLLPFVFFQLLAALSELRLCEQVLRSGMRLRGTLFLGLLYLALYAWMDLWRWPALLRAGFDHLDLVLWAAVACGFLLFLLLGPLWATLAFGLQRLNYPELEEGMQGIAKRLGQRGGGLRVLGTRGRILNAFVIGPFAWTRRVVFSDEILRRFSPTRLLAVYAHELAHVSRKHMWRMLFLALGLPLAVLGALSSEELGEDGDLLLAALLLIPALLILRWLRRRFEHEADLTGVAALDQPEDMIEALEHAHLYGGVGRKGGFFYPSADARVAAIRSFVEDPRETLAWYRRGARIQAGLFVLLGVALGLLLARQLASWPQQQARFLLSAGYPSSAAELWLEQLPAELPATASVAAGKVEEQEPLKPYPLEEMQRGDWELLGEQIHRARLLVHQGESEGPALVGRLHRRALRRAAHAIEGSDLESGRLWLQLAARYSDLSQGEAAVLLLLESWSQHDEPGKRRAVKILQDAPPGAPLNEALERLLGKG
ncbi:MAG: hypothetical protein CSA62_09780 [Planctomycetota bacterium]|nr:MAG: hypothetical protein CSA62_09780 [Planctomycetota bacterium]